MPLLLALAGESRSGKGTAARIFTEEAHKLCLSVRERQLSGPGKQYLASAWKPDISEEEAIEWWESLKAHETCINVSPGAMGLNSERDALASSVSLQQYMQRMLQGARDRWGSDFWTDKLLPNGEEHSGRPAWHRHFSDAPIGIVPADLCLISDLRQDNEAERVQDLVGKTIEMIRPDNNDSYRTGRDHITERGLSDNLVSLRVMNVGTYEDLEAQLRIVFNSHVLPWIKAA